MEHANDNLRVAACAGNRQVERRDVLDLFSAAAGGWSLGMHRAGYRTMAACEVIPWRRALYSENNPGVPVYDDVTTLTADRLVRDIGHLPRIIVGSPPCQDISSANTKGKGVDGERSCLYFEAIRLVNECRPDWYALENSANLRTRGADRVIDALEAIGYTCWPVVVSAGDVGANHERKRSWLIGFNARDAEKDGWRAWWARRRAVAIAGVSVEACGDAAAGYTHGVGRDDRRCGWRSGVDVPNAHDPDGQRDVAHADEERRKTGGVDRGVCGSQEPAPELSSGWCAAGLGNSADTDQARQKAGLLESSLRSAQEPDDGRGDVRSDDVAHTDCQGKPDGTVDGEMGGSPRLGPTPAEPWADWNGGLAGHLRVDDGLSAWVAQSRIAVGGPRGTVAASLIVEAFGDAVVPQIPEAIGRAIARVEAALDAIYAPANDNLQRAA